MQEEKKTTLEEAAEEASTTWQWGPNRPLTLEMFPETYKRGFIAGAEWQYQKDRGEFAKIKAKTWCEGFDAHKQQMLKDAVEADVNTYGDLVAGKSWAEFVVEMPTSNIGDKVKIIIVRSDE